MPGLSYLDGGLLTRLAVTHPSLDGRNANLREGKTAIAVLRILPYPLQAHAAGDYFFLRLVLPLGGPGSMRGNLSLDRMAADIVTSYSAASAFSSSYSFSVR